MSLGCLWGPSGPGLRSVQKVSRECPQSVRDTFLTLRDTLGTLFGHSGARGPKGPQRHPEGHSRDTSGPKGPRDSRSRPGGVHSGSDLMLHMYMRPPLAVEEETRMSIGATPLALPLLQASKPAKVLCSGGARAGV